MESGPAATGLPSPPFILPGDAIVRSSERRAAHMIKRILLIALLLLVAVAIALPLMRNTEHALLDDAARARAPGTFVALPNGQVHVELAGPEDGAPVVLVHGFSVPSYIWDPTFAMLRDAGFRVLRFDLYGRGWSDRPDAIYDRDFFADQLAALMDAHGFARAHVVGLSMGGAIAGRFTARHPERVDRLALIAPLTLDRDISPLHLPGVGEWITRVQFLPRLADGQLNDFVEPERFAEWPARFREQMGYHGFSRALLSTIRHTMTTSSLADFRVIGEAELPVLVVWGREDGVVPFDHHAHVLEAIPHATLLAVDGAGHLPHMERPDVVEPALRKFLGHDHRPDPRPGEQPTNLAANRGPEAGSWRAH
jgi:pimeloyl-ACP methyl ester carboxylesterase